MKPTPCPHCGRYFRGEGAVQQHMRDKPCPGGSKPKAKKGNHYKAEAEDRPTPTCPECGQPAVERRTRYGIRAMCCGLWSWDRHPLVSEETHRARNEAHAAFDTLWKSGLVPRGKAYALLRAEMSLSHDQCHMKLMDAQTARQVPAAVTRIRERLDPSIIDDGDAA